MSCLFFIVIDLFWIMSFDAMIYDQVSVALDLFISFEFGIRNTV